MQLELPWGALAHEHPSLRIEPPPLRVEHPSRTPPRAHGATDVGVEFVRHRRARRYIIRVRDNGTVRVTIPRGGSKREAQDFARRQASWVEQQRERLLRETPRASAAMPLEVEREVLERARRELPVRLLELAAEHGLRVARISIRNQRWRWGSCSRNGHICLNWRLALMPLFVRDYVLIHELMHLKRMDHSPAFWKLVAAACPEYQSARVWLRQHARA
jgi:predicted metal-dependent hydrolase